MVLPSEIGEFSDDVRQVFLELARTSGDALSGECAPPLDVFETDDAFEVSVDLPGVTADTVRVVIKRDMLLVAGEKARRRTGHESTYHLVERGFGRFARVIRLGRACDASRASAVLTDGELTITVPKLVDRRGQAFQVPVTAPRDAASRTD